MENVEEHANCLDVKADLNTCFKVYNDYKKILDTNILDYFTSEHWSKLPENWKTYFEKVSLRDIGYILDTNAPLHNLSTVSPLSILALRSVCKQLSITRYPNLMNSLNYIPTQHAVIKHNAMLIRNGFDYYENKLLNHPKLSNVFWKHISLKKKHEIIHMAQMCSEVAEFSNCDILIDFGSGLGHLARMLAYGYGLKVYCFEAQKNLSLQAQELDNQFEKCALKYISERVLQDYYKPIQINMKIESDTNVTRVLQEFKAVFDLYGENIKFGVIGLHPCGDLAAMLLRSFKNEKRIKFMNLSSCCYMKLTTEGPGPLGYPLSKFLSSRNSYLSYEARELSCHAIEAYFKKLKTGNYIEFKTHAYRATLEKLITKHYPDKIHAGLKNVKCKTDLTFEQYCSKALNGLNLDIPIEDIMNENMVELIQNWKKVVIYNSMRLMFAPMIETILLLDRFLFAAEEDVKCILCPLFEPIVSPRSHILIAIKIDKKH